MPDKDGVNDFSEVSVNDHGHEDENISSKFGTDLVPKVRSETPSGKKETVFTTSDPMADLRDHIEVPA
jgi:hypothetical protein